ncbi:MAG: hypothetical protein B7Y02_11625, partial [Rhodobacterales bacterium 17-64-5]
VSTPVDEQTHLKARFLTTDGAPCGIIYDPELLARTPLSLLLATGIRGLDHAINTACSTQPHPFASLMAVLKDVAAAGRDAKVSTRQSEALTEIAALYRIN